MKSSLLGGAVSVLLIFSVISYAKTLIQRQQAQTSNQQPGNLPTTGPVSDSRKADATPTEVSATASPESLPASVVEKATVSTMLVSSAAPATTSTDSVAAAQVYTATAYSLRGRTASGRAPSRGLIAADQAVLPLGTRVRVEAGSLSGEYVVADTGSTVRGRHIDIWTPTEREARQFGRRAVKLTVLSLGPKRQNAKPLTRKTIQ